MTRLAVVAGVVTALVVRGTRDAVLGALGSIGPAGILAALGVGAVTTFACALRWRILAVRLDLALSVREAVARYYEALFLNAALPGGVVGDARRAVGHGRAQDAVGRGVGAVVLERTVGQVALIAVAAGSLVVLPAPFPVTWSATGMVVGAACLLGVLAVGLGVAGRRRRRTLFGISGRVVAGAARAVAEPRAAAGALALSVLAVAGHITMFLLAARLAGVTAPVTVLVPHALVALLAMALPIGVGGWGPREASVVVTFASAGLGAGTGLATAVVYGVLALVAALPGAGLLLVHRTTRQPAPARVPAPPSTPTPAPASASAPAAVPIPIADVVIPSQRCCQSQNSTPWSSTQSAVRP